MGKILEAFLSGRIHECGVVEQRTAEHQRLCEKGLELHDRLAEKLDGEGKEILGELVDTLFEEGSIAADRKFESGYRLGVLLTTEIFVEQKYVSVSSMEK